jgi:hypothetical protein
MVLQWEPQTFYGYGSVVIYETIKYKIIQPHQSQSDWTPDVTPALWSRLPEEYDCDDHHEGYHTKVEGAPPPEQQVQVTHEEQKKNWWDLDDHRKKELEIGGGLLAGAALLAGGLYAYKKHEANKQTQQAAVWDLQTWYRDAQARTNEYYRNGPKGPVTWVLNKGNNIPQYAIQGGNEEDKILYVARSFHCGGVHPGKCGSHLSRGCSIAADGEECEVDTYEVLIGDSSAVRWVEASGRFSEEKIGARLVEGGREQDGTLLYVAQARYRESIHCGKVSEKLDGCHISYGGVEQSVSEYSVLVYN